MTSTLNDETAQHEKQDQHSSSDERTKKSQESLHILNQIKDEILEHPTWEYEDRGLQEYQSVRKIKDSIISQRTRVPGEPFSFDDIVENINTAIFVTRKDGVILYSNTQALMLLGCTREKIVGSFIMDFLPSRHEFALYSAGKPVQNTYEIKDVDGEGTWVSHTATPIPDTNTVIHELHDVTWTKITEKELLEYTKYLELVEKNQKNEIQKYIQMQKEYIEFIKQTVIDLEISLKTSETYSKYIMKDYSGELMERREYLVPLLEATRDMKLLVENMKNK